MMYPDSHFHSPDGKVEFVSVSDPTVKGWIVFSWDVYNGRVEIEVDDLYCNGNIVGASGRRAYFHINNQNEPHIEFYDEDGSFDEEIKLIGFNMDLIPNPCKNYYVRNCIVPAKTIDCCPDRKLQTRCIYKTPFDS